MKIKDIKPKTIVIILACAAVLGFLAVFIANVIVCAAAREYIYEPEDVDKLDKDFDCILVLGAGLYSDGTPKPMLSDRLTVACESYEAGCSDRLLMSGDHLQSDYNEPGAMKKFAIGQGIDSKVIFLDHAGASTYDSVYRAVKIYGAEKILIVTQRYHLYRSIFIAKSMGVEAYGVSASLRSYLLQPKFTAREWIARVKDLAFSVLKPEASHMGDKIDLSGDGDTTN